MIAAIVRWVVPPEVDPDASQVLRASYVATMLIGATSVWIYAPLLHLVGDTFGAIATSAYLIGALGSTVVLRLSGKLSFAWHWLSGMNFAILAFLALRQGGVGSPATWWLSIIPIGQIAAGLLSSAFFWAAVSIVYVGVLFILHDMGIPVMVEAWDPMPLLFIYACIIGLMVILSAYLALVEQHRRGAFETLLRSNEELERTRDQAVAASRVKSEFLANMSHEIRTPMNGMLGTADLMAGTALNREQRQLMDILIKSSESLMTLINDVLDFSKVEAGQLVLNKSTFSPRELVEDVADMLASRAYEKKLELVCRVKPGVPEAVSGDEARLRQVLVNLLSNAIKFTDHGKVGLAVEVEEMETECVTSLRFEVTDTGIGIEPGQYQHLFQAFSQVDTSSTRRYGGSGLGLAISQSLIRLMHGSIDFDSDPGVKTCFRCVVPFELPAGDVGSEEGRKPGTGIHVLLLEPREASREVIRERLEELGATVYIAPLLLSTHSVNLKNIVPEWDKYDYRVLISRSLLDNEPVWGEVCKQQVLSIDRAIMIMAPLGTISGWTTAGLGSLDVLSMPVRTSALRDFLVGVDGSAAVPMSLRGQRQVRDSAGRSDAKVARRARVLLVEDNSVNQRIAVAMLQRLGCIVDVSTDGQAALDQTADQQYDLILMDCQMPVLDGFDATRGIRTRERESGVARTPIVALTASALTGDREACLAAGMDDYLAKPFRLEKLQAIVEEWSRTEVN